MPKHIYYDGCESGDCGGGCHLCCLAVCKVCGLFEGALTTDCPGHFTIHEQSERIYQGKMDFRDSEGWVDKLNPTNQMWLYGKYVRFHGVDIKFAVYNNISYGNFMEIKDKWIKDGLNISKLNLPKNCEKNSFFRLRNGEH
jgi:hypothetical protein